MAPKTILLTGATGFVGQALGQALTARGDQVLALVRDPESARKKLLYPAELLTEKELARAAHAHAVIHLAGENVAQRWNASAKEKILRSRVELVPKLRRVFAQGGRKVPVFLSASAIGFYGDRGEEILREGSEPGRDFLAEVCLAWEKAAFEFAAEAERVVVYRFGMVLGEGGALAKMLPAFRLGAGGRLGSGEQWVSWIQLEDLVRALMLAVDDPKIKGVYNAVAPENVRNQEFTAALAEAVGTKALLPVPAFGLKLALGEMAGMLLASQRVSAEKLRDTGFAFQYSGLNAALRASLAFSRAGRKDK